MTPIKSSAGQVSIATEERGSGRRLILVVAVVGLVLGLGLTFAHVGPDMFGAVGFNPHLPDPAPLMSASPVIQIHLLAALAAIALGAMMMMSRKGAKFHRTAGWVWVGLMALTAGSSLFITGLNGGSWSLIHLLSGWTLIALPLGIFAARSHKVKQHRRAMMGLFYGGLLIAGTLAFIPGRLLWQTFF